MSVIWLNAASKNTRFVAFANDVGRVFKALNFTFNSAKAGINPPSSGKCSNGPWLICIFFNAVMASMAGGKDVMLCFLICNTAQLHETRNRQFRDTDLAPLPQVLVAVGRDRHGNDTCG